MATATIDQHATIEDVNRLAEIIADNWSLCELFAHKRNACEGEYMVAETIHAAAINAKAHGKPFSLKGNGVHSCGGGGLVNNGAAYGWLIEDGYFVESEHEGRPVIYPTRKLVLHLDAHFSRKAKR